LPPLNEKKLDAERQLMNAEINLEKEKALTEEIAAPAQLETPTVSWN